jgi:large subunit ribosomal protein L24
MYKFKKGDEVKITSGKDKGRTGKIEKVFPKKDLVLIPAINTYKKHVKAAITVDGRGGIFEFARPINVAKIAIICPNCKKTTRIGFSNKKRICKHCKKEL